MAGEDAANGVDCRRAGDGAKGRRHAVARRGVVVRDRVVGVDAAIRATATPLPHDAYVWQRAWTPHVISSVSRSSDIVRAWRLLLAEADVSGRWATINIPWSDVQATQRPVIGVIRIDGRLDEARIPALLDQVMARVDPVSAALAGVEIDYDCPTSKLATYARFLAALRSRLAPSTKLSITALPTWMNSGELERLTRISTRSSCRSMPWTIRAVACSIPTRPSAGRATSASASGGLSVWRCPLTTFA